MQDGTHSGDPDSRKPELVCTFPNPILEHGLVSSRRWRDRAPVTQCVADTASHVNAERGRMPNRRMRAAAAYVTVAALLATLAACGGPYRPQRIHGDAWTLPSETPSRHLERDPETLESAELVGEATWYGARHHGRRTANGERFDMYAFTAAHRHLPFHTVVRVVRDDDLRSVVVRINDRGPGSPERVIDLAWAAAWDIGMVDEGTVDVHLEVLEWGDGAIYE